MNLHRAAPGSGPGTAVKGIVVLAVLASITATTAAGATSTPTGDPGIPARTQVGRSTPDTGPPAVVDPPPGETVRVIVELTTPTRPPAELRGAEADSQEAAIAAAQAEVASTLEGTGSEVASTFELSPGMAVEATAEGLDALRADPGVADIRVDGVVRPLLNVSTDLVNADDAWTTADGTGQQIAIIDTGVSSTHSFLAGKVVYEACFADDTNRNNSAGACPNGLRTQAGAGAGAPCTFALDACRHGTHVAGIAAAADSTYDGVARGADLLSIQVFHNRGGLAEAWFSDIVLALEHLFEKQQEVDYDIAAVNMSLGDAPIPNLCDAYDPSMFSAVQALKDLGVATVVASGNDGVIDALSFPACLSNVISVGNVFSGKPGFAADDVSFDSNAASFLRMLAPGAPITSSVPGNTTAVLSGTSMAAPHVAGAIAVLRDARVHAGVDPVDRVDHLHGLLRASGTCVHDPGIPNTTNDQFARLDVQAALDWAGLPAALFWDIECGAWYEDAANWLGHDPDGTPGPAEPLAAGFSDGSFKGLSPITRAQDARMLFRLFGEPSPDPYTHSFTDVPAWVEEAVNWVNWPDGPASPEPLMTGFGSTFRPNDNITRAAKARQLFRAAGSPVAGFDFSCTSHGFTDVPAWVEDAVIWLTCPDAGPGGDTPIATGYGSVFKPGDDITRAANGRMLQRFDEAGYTL